MYDGEIHCGKRGRVSVPGRGTFALHILVIDHFSPRADGVRMACIQFFTCGLLSSVPMFLLETPKVSDILQAWAPILYAGVLSCGVAYTLQILGQKNVSPTIASLILSLESCISVLAGFIILGEKLSARELSGCVLMFGAIILAQIPEKKKHCRKPGMRSRHAVHNRSNMEIEEIKRKLLQLSPMKIIFWGYCLIILAGSALLMLPASTGEEK